MANASDHARGDGARRRAGGPRPGRAARLRGRHPGAGRPALPGHRLGGRQRDHVHPARPHGRRGERHRRPREPGLQALQGHGHPARRPPPAERRRHRGAAREGHRQVRQAGRASSPRSCPTTNPELTPPGVGIFAIKCRDAVIFSPHPRSKRTTRETVEIMRRALAREGAPADLLQCLERPSIPAAQYLMTQADLVQATGGRDMVKAAYSSGTPAYGVGAGNSTMVIDETADVAEAARNTRLSKTSDYGSGCSADGNLVVEDAIYDALRDRLVAEGGHVDPADETERAAGGALGRGGPSHGGHHRHLGPGHRRAGRASRSRPTGRSSSSSRPRSAAHNPFSSEKLSVVLSMFRYAGFDAGAARWSRPSTRWAARATRAASTRSTTSTSTGSRAWRRSAASWSASRSRRRTRVRSTTACP